MSSSGRTTGPKGELITYSIAGLLAAQAGRASVGDQRTLVGTLLALLGAWPLDGPATSNSLTAIRYLPEEWTTADHETLRAVERFIAEAITTDHCVSYAVHTAAGFHSLGQLGVEGLAEVRAACETARGHPDIDDDDLNLLFGGD